MSSTALKIAGDAMQTFVESSGDGAASLGARPQTYTAPVQVDVGSPRLIRNEGSTWLFWREDTTNLRYVNVSEMLKDKVLVSADADPGKAENWTYAVREDGSFAYDPQIDAVYAPKVETVDFNIEASGEKMNLTDYQIITDRDDNLYVVWTKNVRYKAQDEVLGTYDATAQEIYAMATLREDDRALTQTGGDAAGAADTTAVRWSKPYRLTRDNAYHDGLAIALDEDGGLLILHNQFTKQVVNSFEKMDQLVERREHLFRSHIHFRMIRSDILRHLPGIFQIDGILVHADGKGPDGLSQKTGGDGTHQTGIQSSGEEESQRRIRIQTLVHAKDQKFPDLPADVIQLSRHRLLHVRDIGIADELTLIVIVSRREGADLFTQPHQVLRLAGKHHGSVRHGPVKQRPDTDGIPGGDDRLLLGIVDEHGKLRIQFGEHLQPVPVVQRKDDLAVGSALKLIIPFQLRLQRAEEVQFSVAYAHVSCHMKRLHPLLRQAHDGQTVETQISRLRLFDAGHVRSPGDGPVKILPDLLLSQRLTGKTHNSAHNKSTSESICGSYPVF